MEIQNSATVSLVSNSPNVQTAVIPSFALRMNAPNATNQTTHISSHFSTIQRFVNVLSLKIRYRAILATMTSIALKTMPTVVIT
jgi:hypothetical protein